MRCLGCKAWKDGKCLAGIAPYRSKNERDGIGCACNTRTVEKLLRQNRKTNAARIRGMTDEELAELFMQEYDGADSFTCPVPHPCPPEKEASCRECFLDWLKEEVRE